MLGEWKLPLYRKIFPAKQHFFNIDQLIAENPKSSKQTFKGAISDFGKSPSLIYLLVKQFNCSDDYWWTQTCCMLSNL